MKTTSQRNVEAITYICNSQYASSGAVLVQTYHCIFARPPFVCAVQQGLKQKNPGIEQKSQNDADLNDLEESLACWWQVLDCRGFLDLIGGFPAEGKRPSSRPTHGMDFDLVSIIRRCFDPMKDEGEEENDEDDRGVCSLSYIKHPERRLYSIHIWFSMHILPSLSTTEFVCPSEKQ